MLLRAETEVLVSLLLLCLEFAPRARGEVCYSQQSGFQSCSNGCCGSDDDQSCCSQVFLIVGLSVGAVLVLIVVVVLLVCWVCKGSQPKVCGGCCGDGESRGRRRRRREERERRWRRHWRGTDARHVEVDPVQPPDYNTATQERAPSVQPGRSHRIHPLSPPPPYIETVPPPPPSTLRGNTPRSESDKITTTAPSATSLSVLGSPMERAANGRHTCHTVHGQSSSGTVYASSGQSAMSSRQRPHQNGHGVIVVQPSVSVDTPRPSDNSPRDTTFAGRHHATNRLSPAPESAAPNHASPPGSPLASHYLLHVRGSPGAGVPRRQGDGDGGSSQVTARGPEHPARGAALDTVNEAGEGDDQLDLV